MAKNDLLWTYLKAITFTKKNFLFDKESEEGKRFPKEYSSFMIGRMLYGHLRTVHLANEVNTMRKMTPERHYIFLLNSVPAENRRYAFPKRAKENHDAEALSIYYEVSLKRAKEYLRTHTEEQLQYIREAVGPLTERAG